MTAMDEQPRILFVDDEPNVLEGFERTLFDHFDVHTALSGEAGLELINAEGPFAVVVSDMRMPGMSGAAFLAQVRTQAPTTVRILLTGYTDIEAAIAAVNDGNIFRFLCKPCPQDTLVRALNDAVEQHRLIIAEHELLEKTLHGAAQVLIEMLSIASPLVFSRSQQIRSYVAYMAQSLGIKNPWEYNLAAMLCQIGCIAIPPDTLARIYAGQTISDAEQQMFDGHPQVGYRLLAHIPRLKQVALMISGLSEAGVSSQPKTQLGAEMLRIAVALDRLVMGGGEIEAAITRLLRQEIFSKKLLIAMSGFQPKNRAYTVRAVFVREMNTSMVLDEDVLMKNGNVVVSAGRDLNTVLIARLKHFSTGVGLVEPIRVRLPA